MTESPYAPQRTEKTVAVSKLIFGLSLIAIGIVYSLDRLGYVMADELWDYWPALLIAAGAGKWINPGGSRVAGSLLAILGLWLLLENLGFSPLSFDVFWPALLIAIGLYVLLTPRVETRSRDGESVNQMAVMAGSVCTNSSPSFKGGDMMAVMGGCEIDLTGARIAAGQRAVIDAFAFFGGVEIKVPAHWEVTAKGIPVIGGFEDETEPSAELGEPLGSERLTVTGFALFGGVVIRN